jgi:hypothetical protein
MIVDTLIGQMKFSGHVSIDRVPVRRTFGGLARRMSGGPDPKFSVNSLGFPAVLFIRRPSGGFDPKFTSTPILTIFPLKLILFFFTLVFMGSSSFVKDFSNWV